MLPFRVSLGFKDVCKNLSCEVTTVLPRSSPSLDLERYLASKEFSREPTNRSNIEFSSVQLDDRQSKEPRVMRSLFCTPPVDHKPQQRMQHLVVCLRPYVSSLHQNLQL